MSLPPASPTSDPAASTDRSSTGATASRQQQATGATTTGTHPVPEQAPPLAGLIRGMAILVRTGTAGLVVAGITAAGSAWLQATRGMSADAAAGLRSDCLVGGIIAAVAAMCSAGVQAGAISRREAILRERARAEAERARQERRRAREAAAEEAARQHAEAVRAREEFAEARALLEARAEAERAAAEADPEAHQERARLYAEQVARQRELKARMEHEEKVERAIISGGRAA